MGLQLVYEFIKLTDNDVTAKVVLTNLSKITQQVEAGTEIGVGSVGEVVKPPPQPTQVLIPGNVELPMWNPDEVLCPENHSQTEVKIVTSTKQRKMR